MNIKRGYLLSLDVDAQKTFTPLCPDELPVEGGHEIGGELNAQASYAQYRAGSKDCHPRNGCWVASDRNPQFSPIQGFKNLDIRWNLHGEHGTYGFELLEDLPSPQDYDYFVWKGMEPDMHPYGACFHDLANKQSTGIIEWAKSKNITHVVVGGLATDYCVLTTVHQLVGAGFKVIVNKSACRGIWNEISPLKLYKDLEDKGCIVIEDASELDNLP